MNVFQLAALQLQLLNRASDKAEWTSSVSARSNFSGCSATPGWIKTGNSSARFESIATEKHYLWNISNVTAQINLQP